jgi:LSD1 subclass zinc finger protein
VIRRAEPLAARRLRSNLRTDTPFGDVGLILYERAHEAYRVAAHRPAEPAWLPSSGVCERAFRAQCGGAQLAGFPPIIHGRTYVHPLRWSSHETPLGGRAMNAQGSRSPRGSVRSRGNGCEDVIVPVGTNGCATPLAYGRDAGAIRCSTAGSNGSVMILPSAWMVVRIPL